MKITFDLISDLHLDDIDNCDWSNKGTSLFCIVAGNISNKRDVLLEFLDELKDHYEAVFYIDGPLDHESYKGDFASSYENLIEGIELIDKVIFLHENIIVLNGVTLIGTNGWTTFDFTSNYDIDSTIQFLQDQDITSEDHATEIFKMAITDQHYMYNSVETCQTIEECNSVLVVTNSVPHPEFIAHNEDYNETILGATIGNNGITDCIHNDKQSLIKTWIFGKFPEDLDFDVNGIRFVNNPKPAYTDDTYFPKRIEI